MWGLQTVRKIRNFPWVEKSHWLLWLLSEWEPSEKKERFILYRVICRNPTSTCFWCRALAHDWLNLQFKAKKSFLSKPHCSVDPWYWPLCSLLRWHCWDSHMHVFVSLWPELDFSLTLSLCGIIPVYVISNASFHPCRLLINKSNISHWSSWLSSVFVPFFSQPFANV